MQQPQRQHRQQCKFPLDNDKCDEKDDPDDEHGDDEGRVPGVFCAAEGDGDEDEDDSDEGRCEAEEVDFFEFGFEGSGDGFEGEKEGDLDHAEGCDGERNPEYPSPLSTLLQIVGGEYGSFLGEDSSEERADSGAEGDSDSHQRLKLP